MQNRAKIRKGGAVGKVSCGGRDEEVSLGFVQQQTEFRFSAEESNMQFTAIFQKVPEGYIGFVEELPGANTQGDTLEEARENLAEAVELVLEANRELAEERISK